MIFYMIFQIYRHFKSQRKHYSLSKYFCTPCTRLNTLKCWIQQLRFSQFWGIILNRASKLLKKLKKSRNWKEMKQGLYWYKYFKSYDFVFWNRSQEWMNEWILVDDYNVLKSKAEKKLTSSSQKLLEKTSANDI